MFLPWMNSFVSVSGWGLADGGSVLSNIAYLVYFVPIGSALVIYFLLVNKPIPGWVRFTGFVPPMLLLGAFWKMYNALGGKYFDMIIMFKIFMF